MAKRVVAQFEYQVEVVAGSGEFPGGRCSYCDVTGHAEGTMAFGKYQQSAPRGRRKGSSGGRASPKECHEKTSGEALSPR